ncbi:MAG TPA: glycoside hydrolase domain-containing protein [Longimicrobiales bacterium]
MQRIGNLITAAAVLSLATACVAPARVAVRPEPRGVPGFDTRDYPGDAVMRGWFGDSPYRWVGYYLPAPCYTGTTWTGRRSSLRAMGWGFAVLYVGEQDWGAMGARTDTSTAPSPRCTSAHLTAEQGRAHGEEAAAAAAADGFPGGTIIFLDVERVDRVSPELATYVRGWTVRVLEDGRFEPGLYAHDVNVEALYPLLADEYARHQRSGRPALWVARTTGFDLLASPRESGYAAAIWQGILNTREEWNGGVLNIDVNVADSPDPSRGR